MFAGWLDRLPPAVRHALFSAAAVLLTGLLAWFQANYTTLGLPVWALGVIASFLPVVIAAVTNWTKQYGVSNDGSTVLVTEPVASAPVESPDQGAVAASDQSPGA